MIKNQIFKKVCRLAMLFFLLTSGLKGSAATYYWVGGTGVWTDLTHWATSSGGSVNPAIVPTPIDDVVFDANSFSSSGGTVTINFEGFCKDFIVTSGITSNVTFNFTAGINAANVFNINPSRKITWNQLSRITAGAGATFRKTNFTMNSGLIQIFAGNLNLYDSTYFVKSGNSDNTKIDAGTLVLDGTSKFTQNKGYFYTNQGDVVVPAGATFYSSAYTHYIKNGSFVGQPLAIITIDGQWEITDGGFDVNSRAFYTKNASYSGLPNNTGGYMYFYATHGGTYNIRGGNKDMHRIELGGTNYNVEYKLQDTLKVTALGAGIYPNANKFISNGFPFSTTYFWAWSGNPVTVDLTGTDTATISYQFGIYPNTNTTYINGDATIKFDGTNSFIFYPGNKTFRDVVFNATATYATQIYSVYGGTFRDVTINAYGQQYLEMNSSSVFRNFTVNHLSATSSFYAPKLKFYSPNAFRGIFKTTSVGSGIRPSIEFLNTDSFGTIDVGNISEMILGSGSTQYYGNFTAINGSCQQTVLIRSSSGGSKAYMRQNSGTVSVNWAQLQDIDGAGGATFTATNTINLGNVSGWNISTIPAQNFYWIGGTGNWSDPSHWSLTSGGTAGCAIPSRIDNVFFDANSYTASNQYCTVDVNAECKNLNWTGITTGAGINGSQQLNVFGSLKLDANMNFNYNGSLYFQAVNTGNTIETQNKTLPCQIYFQGQNQTSGEWRLLDKLTTTSTLYLNYGTFKSNGYNLDIYSFQSGSGGAATADFTGGTTLVKVNSYWYLYYTILKIGSADILMQGNNYLQFNSYGSATGINRPRYNTVTIDNQNTSNYYNYYQGMNNTMANFIVKHNGDGTFYDYNQGGDSIANATFTFGRDFQTTNSYYYLYGYGGTKYYGNLTFSGNGANLPRLELYYPIVAKKLTINNLSTFKFNPSYTCTIDTLIINGTCLYRTNVGSMTAGTQATLNNVKWAVATYANVADLKLNGGGTYSGTNSVLLGNVTNWTMSSTPTNYYWVAGAGNWNDVNHWSNTSGGSPAGCLPGAGDNVFFDVNSFTAANQTVNLNVNGYCNNMVWNNVNNPRFSGGYELHVYGSMVLAPNLTWQQTGFVYFDSRKNGNTINTNGVKMYRAQFYGEGGYLGEWTLQNNLTVTDELYLRSGKFISAGYQVNARSITNDYNDSRITIDFTGTDTIYASHEVRFSSLPTAMMSGTNIKFTNSYNNTNRLYGGNKTFKDVQFNHTYNNGLSGPTIEVYDNNTFRNVTLSTIGWPAITYSGSNVFNDVTYNFNNATTNIPTVTYQGANTFNNLTVTSTGNGGPYLSLNQNNSFNSLIAAGLGTRLLLGASTTQTVNSLLALGNGSYPVIVKSQTQGTQATIYKPSGKVCLDFVLMQDIRANGLPNGSGGIQTTFFAGASSVNLGNNTNWNFSSCNAFYWVGDNGNWSDYANHWATSSGGTTFQTTVPGANDDVYFDANSFTTGGRTVNVDVSTVNVRDMKWGSATYNPTFTGSTEIRVYGDLELISNMNQNFTGEWKFMASDTGHVLNSGGKSMTNVSFIGGNSGAGAWKLLNPLNVSNNLNFDNGTLISNNKDINTKNFNSTTSNTRSLQLGSSTVTVLNGSWNPATLTNAQLVEGTSTIVMTGTGSSSAFYGNNLTYNNVTFTTTGTLAASLAGSNTFNTLKVEKGLTLSVESANQNMNQLVANGTCANLINIKSSTPGTQATFTKTSGVVNATFLNLTDIKAQGGATFNANYSNNISNNTGWNFTTPPSLNVTVNTTDVSCTSNNNGTATVTSVTGGISPYSYLWSTTETTPGISNLIPGTYTVKVTDSAGCFLTQNVVAINTPSYISAVPFSASAVDVCLGTTINFTAGSPAQTVTGYKWNFGDFTTTTVQNPSKTFTTGGTYQVTLQYLDSGGCPATVSKTIRISDISRSIASTNVQCFGTGDGSITITASGGVQPLQYSIDNGTSYASSGVFANLAPGTYQVKVKDSINCTTNATAVTITQPSAVLAQTNTPTGTSCQGTSDGSIVFSATGGTTPYNYSINNGILFVTGNSFQNLTSGTYNLVVRDARNCATTAQTINLSVYDTVKPVIICPSNVSVGPDSGSCSASVNIAAPSTADNCGVASIVNNFNNTGNASGSYPIGTTNVVWTVTDVNNNTKTCTQTVHVSGLPIQTSNGGPVCVRDTIKLYASGGVSYSWTGPNGFTSTYQNPVILNATAAMAGTYTVTVVNAQNCSGTGTTSVTVNALPVMSATNNGPICEGGTVNLSASGAVSYIWSGPNSFATTTQNTSRSNLQVSDSGVYTVKGTGANGCRDDVSTSVAVKPLPEATITSASNAFCTGGSLLLNANTGSGLTYVWRKDGNSISGATASTYTATTAGSYTLIVTSNGCSKTSAAKVVTINTNPSLSIAPANAVTCAGSNITLTGSNNVSTTRTYSIALSNLINQSSSCATGSYYNGCSSQSPGFSWVDIGTGSVTNVQITFAIGVECHNGFTHTTTLNSVAGPSFAQTPGWCQCAGQASSTASNVTLNFTNPNYNTGSANTFYIGNVNTCMGFIQTAALNNSFAVVTVTYAGSGSSIASWSWTPGGDTTASKTVSPTTTTTYSLTGTTAAGCSTTVSKTVTVNALPAAPTANNAARCSTGSVTISASVVAGNTVDWYANATGGSPLVSGTVNYTTPAISATTVYYAETRNTTTGCKSSTRTAVTATVNSLPTASISAGSSTSFCPGGSVVLTSSAASSYLWSNNTTASTLTVSSSGNYSVTVTDANNCSATSAPISVWVGDTIQPTVTCKTDTVLLNASGTATITASNVVAASADNCGNPSISLSISSFTATNVGNNTVIVTATDASNNIARCTTNVYVIEPAPVALCKNATLYLNAAGKVVLTPSVIDNGSYSLVGISNRTVSKDTFDCSNVGTNSVTLTVYNSFNKDASCTATVTIIDSIKPTVNTQNYTLYLGANGAGSLTVANIDNGSSDACGIASRTLSKTSFECTNVGSNTVTLTVVDVNGNSNTGTATVTVVDNTAPSVTTQNYTLTLAANGTGSIAVADIDNGSSDACGIASRTLSKTSFDCTNVGSNTVTLTVVDVNGNSNTGTATVTVVDNTAPSVTTQNYTLTLAANGTGSIAVADIDNGSSDACGIASRTLSKTSFDCTNVGSNTVTLTVVDVNGNSNTNTATVTVVDNTAPSVTTQNYTLTLAANGTGSIAVTNIDNGSSDACGIASRTLSKTSFDCTNVGSNTVTLTVVDVNGNSNTGTATVTVVDNTVPSVTTQNYTLTLAANGTGSIAVTNIDNGSSDACGIASRTLSKTSFDCTNVGSNTVTLTVVDVNGNSNTGTATVTVVDNTAPSVTTQNVTINLSASGSASIAVADIDNGSSDACGIASRTLSKTSFDCTNVGSNTVTLTVVDVNGNSNTGTATVTVVDNTAPSVTTQNVTINLSTSGSASIAVADIDNGSLDACGIASRTLSKTSFDCSNVGSNTVTLTVVDVNGNSNTGTATVTVVDNTAPSVTTQNVTVTLSNGTASVTAAQVNNGSSDACGIASMSVSPSSFNCTNIGSNTVTLTVTDVNGNSNTATATVTVVGAIPSVSIAQGLQPGFTQGGAIVLTAASATATSYAWTSGPSTPVNYVYASGNYTVTVTNIYGCTANATTAVNYTANNLLSSYVIISKKEVELEDHVTVHNGGVGSTSSCGEVEVKDASTITASGTFVRAKDIEVKSGSSVTTKTFTAVPTSILPTFLYNPYCNSNNNCNHSHHNSCGNNNNNNCNGGNNNNCNHSHHNSCNSNNNNQNSNNNKNVNQNATVTITDSIMGTVVIGKNSTVTFTAARLYIKDLEIKEGATVKFTQCAVMRVCNHVKMAKNTKFNTVNSTLVTIYVEKKFDVDEGSHVIANAYSQEDIKIEGKSSSPTTMRGLFIGDEVKAEDYVNFYWNTNTTCGNNNYKADEEFLADESGLIDTYFDANVYPNPAISNFNVRLFSSSKESFVVNVYDMSGKLMDTRTVTESLLNMEMGSSYARGMYIIVVTQGNNTKTMKIVKADR
jgi:hypothetical protein